MEQTHEDNDGLPLVFAQSTDRNDRICSLLSSILMRSPVEKFVDATERSFPSSIEGNPLFFCQSANNKDDSQISCPTLVTFEMMDQQQKSSPALGYLVEILKKRASIRLAPQKLLATTSHSSNNNILEACSMAIDQVLQRFPDSIFFAAEGETATALAHALNRRLALGKGFGSLKGVALLRPSKTLALTIPVPTIVVFEHNQSWSSSMIVQSPWNIAVMKSFSDPSAKQATLWVARLVVKYMTAVLCTQENQQPSSASLGQRSRL